MPPSKVDQYLLPLGKRAARHTPKRPRDEFWEAETGRKPIIVPAALSHGYVRRSIIGLDLKKEMEEASANVLATGQLSGADGN